jgi:hypothetical protein
MLPVLHGDAFVGAISDRDVIGSLGAALDRHHDMWGSDYPHGESTFP